MSDTVSHFTLDEFYEHAKRYESTDPFAHDAARLCEAYRTKDARIAELKQQLITVTQERDMLKTNLDQHIDGR